MAVKAIIFQIPQWNCICKSLTLKRDNENLSLLAIYFNPDALFRRRFPIKFSINILYLTC